MLNKSKELSQQESIDKDLVHFEHPRFENIKYQIFNKDVRNLPEYMPKRDYTLILADIPYGLQTKGCEHDDVAWRRARAWRYGASHKVCDNCKWVPVHHHSQRWAILHCEEYFGQENQRKATTMDAGKNVSLVFDHLCVMFDFWVFELYEFMMV